MFDVERIISHKKVDGNIFYLVKWEHYPNSENTWEPESNFENNYVLQVTK